ncbi:hypothetical protein ABOM_010017 [Aspergillus bombycis]|uniref:Uncharacterized protein n=1 Tax=Aspergillus bombycis TaxID=109264 RepID=A0A1F7ZPC9_9EURO|nr:hypothetical protein ABOM_010017 [Aspergillus bombycis]OGM40915.1 hypothetical protein ABOM_010017 [Aspergillus bombycis]
MTSSASHHQHPSSSVAEFSAHQTAPSSNIDPNGNIATSGYAPNESQLAGLVEAATAAAGQDVSPEWAAAAAVAAAAGAAGHQHHLDGYPSDMHIEDDSFADAGFGTGLGAGRQLRAPGPSANEHSQPSGLSRTVSKKRKRDGPLDPALTASGPGGHQQQPHQHNTHHYGGESLDIRSFVPPTLEQQEIHTTTHVEAFLFTGTITRKLPTFTSRCQAYMLDDKHPERRECVGQRGKGDTEMVKLRLWNCVRHFLEIEGHGERFFGENVVNEGMGPRTYVWPRDQQKIIALVIPLLRRMVTNERQRQYAVETRKGGGSEERRRRKTEDSLQNMNSASPPKFPVEEQLQMHAQHHPPEGYAPTHPELGATSQDMELGLTDLLPDSYPADWNAISKTYETYNQNYELDNLWYLSGLQQPDWRGLVAAVDSHYQVIHNGGFDCPSPCEDENINHILHANSVSCLRWRVGGDRNQVARNEFASSITRDLSRIIRDNIATKHGVQTSTDDHASMHPSNFPPLPAGLTMPNPPTTSQAPISLRINIMQNGKRVLPRVDLPAGHCQDLETLKQLLCRRFAGQLPGLPSDPSLDPAAWVSSVGWRFRVWLPEGLTPVQNDGDWTIAILSAGNVDWMDGDLRVLVELESTS